MFLGDKAKAHLLSNLYILPGVCKTCGNVVTTPLIVRVHEIWKRLHLKTHAFHQLFMTNSVAMIRVVVGAKIMIRPENALQPFVFKPRVNTATNG